MRLLLDTHIYLWAVTDNPKLTKVARKIITEADEVFVSSASIWEASIKAGLGKLDVDVNLLVTARVPLTLSSKTLWHPALVRASRCNSMF